MRDPVDYAVEGLPDAAMAVRLLDHAGLNPGRPFIAGGKQTLIKRLPGYVSAARFMPWLVIIDQDSDPTCPGEIAGQLMPTPPPHMTLGIAVREVESWVLADAKGVASFLGVPGKSLPQSPDDLHDPKAALIQLVARCRRRRLRHALLPVPGSGRKVGPEYAPILAEFVRTDWSIANAAERSSSLARALNRLQAYRTANAP